MSIKINEPSPLSPSSAVDDDAAREDAKVQAILYSARSRRPAAPASEKSLNDSAIFMTAMSAGSERFLRDSIVRGELLTEDQLADQISSRQWVRYARNSGRIFTIQSAEGVSYFPAFFACSLQERRILGRVTKILSGLPGPSVFHFFSTESTMLGLTPLEALADGRVADVVLVAKGFASR